MRELERAADSAPDPLSMAFAEELTRGSAVVLPENLSAARIVDANGHDSKDTRCEEARDVGCKASARCSGHDVAG